MMARQARRTRSANERPERTARELRRAVLYRGYIERRLSSTRECRRTVWPVGDRVAFASVPPPIGVFSPHERSKSGRSESEFPTGQDVVSANFRF